MEDSLQNVSQELKLQFFSNKNAMEISDNAPK